MNLRELSQLLGLSQTTVSRALNGFPEVSKETRARVQQAALQHGYHPNRAAAGLATGRTGAIGIVYNNTSNFGPHTSEFLGGLSRRLQKNGMDILITSVSSEAEEIAAYRRLAASKQVDAIVLHSPSQEDDRIALLQDLGLPFILHGRVADPSTIAYMDIDNMGAIRQATTYLLDLGHQRIAIVNGFLGRTFADHRAQGYAEALAERGLAVDPALSGNGEFTDDAGFRFMKGFLALPDPPTAVLAGSMMSALGAMRAIRTAGLQVGKDVSLIAHDDVFPYINAENMVPTLSTTRSSIGAAGTHIGEMLVQLLAGTPVTELQDVWPVDLVVRASTAARRT
ncbi:MAG: substrate-binding domain-containing protein [Hyphomicrobiales bacterium]